MPAGGGYGLKRPRPTLRAMVGGLSSFSSSHPLAAVLQQVDRHSCPTRFNFHCHTVCSDGSLSPAELAQQAVSIGLEHLAITDHHSNLAFEPASQWLEDHRDRIGPAPVLWRGVEISCLLEGCLVHVLGLGFGADHPSLVPYLQGSAVVGPSLRAETVVRAIQEAGGLALLAHPARYRLPFAPLLEAAFALGFDGAEAWYDYQMQTQWQPTPHTCEAIARHLNKRGLLMSCGTDTHGFALDGR